MSIDYRISLIGFGEVGQTLAADLHARGARNLTAWDLQFPNPASTPSRALTGGWVRAARNAQDAVASANVVISVVTAAQDLEATEAAAVGLAPSAFFLDLNSVSPEVKQTAARLIDARSGRYVEGAVMSPVPQKRIASPILLGGPHAAAFLTVAHELGFKGSEVFSTQIGPASAAKMCRSVMIKGIEALLAESLLTARAYGVETHVLASLHELFATRDWRALARYMISRSLQHGARRAEEMHEVARTVAAAGLEPVMSSACAQRQRWASNFREATQAESLEDLLDRVLGASKAARGRLE